MAAHLGLRDDSAAAALEAELPVAIAAVTGRLRARCPVCADHPEDLLVFADDEAARTPRPWFEAVRQTAMPRVTFTRLEQSRREVHEAPAPELSAASAADLHRARRQELRRLRREVGPAAAAKLEVVESTRHRKGRLASVAAWIARTVVAGLAGARHTLGRRQRGEQSESQSAAPQAEPAPESRPERPHAAPAAPRGMLLAARPSAVSTPNLEMSAAREAAAAPTAQGFAYFAVPAYPQVRLLAVGQSTGTTVALLPVPVPAQSETEYDLMADLSPGEAAGAPAPAAAVSPAPSLVGWEVRVTPSSEGATSTVTAVANEEGAAFLDGLPPSALDTAWVEVRPPRDLPPAEL